MQTLMTKHNSLESVTAQLSSKKEELLVEGFELKFQHDFEFCVMHYFINQIWGLSDSFYKESLRKEIEQLCLLNTVSQGRMEIKG